MVSLNHLQDCSFKDTLYNTLHPECTCVELQMNIAASLDQLALFLIHIISCTTGSMPHEINYCNCHNKSNLTDHFIFFLQSAAHNDQVYCIITCLSQIHIFEMCMGFLGAHNAVCFIFFLSCINTLQKSSHTAPLGFGKTVITW